MATEKPRFTITMSEDLYNAIDKYRFEKKYRTQTQAVVDLIDLGLEGLDPNHGEVSSDEFDIIKKYRALDERGKEVVDSVLTVELKHSKSRQDHHQENIELTEEISDELLRASLSRRSAE